MFYLLFLIICLINETKSPEMPPKHFYTHEPFFPLTRTIVLAECCTYII